jgi:putative membrane protein
MVLLFDLGGLYAYYLSPLFAVADRHPWLHLAVHLHMFLAGCLLSWYVVGLDPMPSRRSTRTALLVLVIAAGGHDVLAKLMYAHTLPEGSGPSSAVEAGAQLMLYGGDAVEIALAVAVMLAWYRRTGRELDRQQRRAARPAGTSASNARHARTSP